MDYKKLHKHIAKRYDIYLFEDEIKEIVRVVLEMDDQKIFNHMYDEHDLLLLQSQMREIIDIVLEMHNENPETCTMKTAMQELIDDLKEFRHEQTSPLVISTMNKVLLKASLLTTKEKEQIVNAYNSGQQIPPFEFAEKYYNETYTNPDQV